MVEHIVMKEPVSTEASNTSGLTEPSTIQTTNVSTDITTLRSIGEVAKQDADRSGALQDSGKDIEKLVEPVKETNELVKAPVLENTEILRQTINRETVQAADKNITDTSVDSAYSEQTGVNHQPTTTSDSNQPSAVSSDIQISKSLVTHTTNKLKATSDEGGNFITDIPMDTRTSPQISVETIPAMVLTNTKPVTASPSLNTGGPSLVGYVADSKEGDIREPHIPDNSCDTHQQHINQYKTVADSSKQAVQDTTVKSASSSDLQQSSENALRSDNLNVELNTTEDTNSKQKQQDQRGTEKMTSVKTMNSSDSDQAEQHSVHSEMGSSKVFDDQCSVGNDAMPESERMDEENVNQTIEDLHMLKSKEAYDDDDCENDDFDMDGNCGLDLPEPDETESMIDQDSDKQSLASSKVADSNNCLSTNVATNQLDTESQAVTNPDKTGQILSLLGEIADVSETNDDEELIALIRHKLRQEILKKGLRQMSAVQGELIQTKVTEENHNIGSAITEAIGAHSITSDNERHRISDGENTHVSPARHESTQSSFGNSDAYKLGDSMEVPKANDNKFPSGVEDQNIVTPNPLKLLDDYKAIGNPDPKIKDNVDTKYGVSVFQDDNRNTNVNPASTLSVEREVKKQVTPIDSSDKNQQSISTFKDNDKSNSKNDSTMQNSSTSDTNNTDKVVAQPSNANAPANEHSKKKEEPVVIDLDVEPTTGSRNDTLKVRGEITPVKQARPGMGPTPTKTLAQSPRSMQSPGQSPLGGGRKQTSDLKTPTKRPSNTKKNFIENLIATGIPIIIPDDDESISQDKPQENKSKLAPKRYYESLKSTSTFGDLAERSPGPSDLTEAGLFTPPRVRPPPQRYEMGSPEPLTYRQRPIAPKPMSTSQHMTSTLAQESYSYQPLPPRRQLSPFQERPPQNDTASPLGSPHGKSNLDYVVPGTISSQFSSASVLQHQFLEQTSKQYPTGSSSKSYAGGPISKPYTGGQGSQQSTVGPNPQQYPLGASHQQRQLDPNSQLQYIRQSPQRHTVGESSTIQYFGQLPQRQHLGENLQMHYAGQSPQRQSIGELSNVQYIVGQSPQRQHTKESSQMQYPGKTPQRQQRQFADQSPQRQPAEHPQRQQRQFADQSPHRQPAEHPQRQQMQFADQSPQRQPAEHPQRQQRQFADQSPQRQPAEHPQRQQRQFADQSPQRQPAEKSPHRHIDQRPRPPQFRRIAPLPSQTQPPGKKSISGTLVIIDDDTPTTTSKQSEEPHVKESMKNVKNKLQHSAPIERQGSQESLLPLVIENVQSMAPIRKNADAKGINEKSSSVKTSDSLPLVQQESAKVTIKQEPPDTHEETQMNAKRNETDTSKRERSMEKTETKMQAVNEPPLKRIKIEPGTDDSSASHTLDKPIHTLDKPMQQELPDSSTKLDMKSMTDDKEYTKPSHSYMSSKEVDGLTTQQSSKRDKPVRSLRGSKPDAAIKTASPAPEAQAKKVIDSKLVSPSKQKPEVILDIDVDDAEGYRRNLALEHVLQSMPSMTENTELPEPEDKQAPKKKTGASKASKAQQKKQGTANVDVSVKIKKEDNSADQKDKTDWSAKGDNSQKQFGCGDCGKTFNSKKSLGQHFKIHTREKPFECDVCGKHFSMKACLKKHIYTHFDEKK